MEKKPEKKDDLSIVNNVLKLATKLLKVSFVSLPSSMYHLTSGFSLQDEILISIRKGDHTYLARF